MKKFKTIIIFTINPINDDFAKRYGVKFLKDNNFKVVFLNLCALIHGIDVARQLGWDRPKRSSEVTEFFITDYQMLEIHLRSYRNESIIYLNITTPGRLLALISKLSIPYIEGSLWGGIQTIDWNIKRECFLRKIYSKLLKVFLEPKKHLKAKWSYLLYTLVRKFHPPFLIVTNNYDIFTSLVNQNVILSHTFDYDRYLANKNLEKPKYIPKDKYFVLLPNHAWMVQDYIINNAYLDCSMTQERYSNLINRTLDKIEFLTGTKILVAGYPNATPEENVYIGREFLLGKETEQLVKYSSGVITHFSGAINFAVLHSKPVCIINYIDFDNDPRFTNAIKSYSDFLGIPINYVDTNADVEKLFSNGLFSLDLSFYNEYYHKFIRPNELTFYNEKPFWQRVIENINKV